MQHGSSSQHAEEFIQAVIDSVPHLETLLLLWTTRPRTWSAPDVAGKVYIETPRARDILDSLTRRGLLAGDERQTDCFHYASVSGEQDQLMHAVEQLYKTELIRITRMIHSKAAPALRDFAQAFRLKKE